MSGHVASHTSIFPNFHGRIVHPSGRFPSDLYNPDGSSREGTLADVNALWMILFTSAWRGCRPSLNRQLRPWWPSHPPWHHNYCTHEDDRGGVPSLRPTATRVVSSSIRSPRADTGRAFNHAPVSFLLTARRRARDLASGALSIKAWTEALTLGESHSL